jgi:hypothetical protein
MHPMNRRSFLGTALLSTAAVLPSKTVAAPGRKRIAMITTVYKYLSHGQHMGDRFLVGYPFEGEWHEPDMTIASLYVDQRPAGDLSEARAQEFGFKVYPSIAETLCCGGDKLAVDAVLIIGEHGDYPVNEKGQKLYPRFEFFEQCVAVFRKAGRSVPIYTDKALSYSFEKAKRMVEFGRELRFPVLAGSSLPVTFRLPDIDIPYGSEIEEALIVGEYGGDDAMDFHALEALQCMVERRKGGEAGIRSVQTIAGEECWHQAFSRELLSAALFRSDTPLGLTVQDGRTQDLLGSGVLPKLVSNPEVSLIEYRDGLKATMVNLRGAVQDFTFAARMKGGRNISTQFLLTPEPNVTYSACLMHKAEAMFETRQAPWPVERTLLTSGLLEACHTSKFDGNRRLTTPHLDVRYRAPSESQYCRT